MTPGEARVPQFFGRYNDRDGNPIEIGAVVVRQVEDTARATFEVDSFVLARLSERGIVELDEERKAAMVGTLLVVLCGDRATQPVVITGSLYH